MRETIREDVAAKNENEEHFLPLSATLKDCTRLNVRDLPNPTARVIGLLNATDHIKVDGTYKNPSWVKVISPKFGYVNRKFIEVK